MPRNRKSRKSKKSSGGRKASTNGIARDATSTIPFRDIISFTWTASNSVKTVVINPTITVRSTAMAALWNTYRIIDLEIHISPFTDSVVASNEYAFSYIPYLNGTAPTTFNEIVEQGTGVVHSAPSTVPTKYKVPRAMFTGMPNMFLPTVASDPSTEFGFIAVCPAGAGTATIYCEMRLVLQFKYPTNSSVERGIPMDEFLKLARRQDTERRIEAAKNAAKNS
jgi:hypothetical protein